MDLETTRNDEVYPVATGYQRVTDSTTGGDCRRRFNVQDRPADTNAVNDVPDQG